jgi:membrane dipeptidase
MKRAIWIAAVIIGGSGAMGDTIAQRTARIHHQAVVIDTHCDTTPHFEDPSWDFTQRHSDTHIDLPRLREGGYDAIFWAIYMGKTPGDGTAIKTALKRIDAVHELVRKYPNDLVLATRVHQIKIAPRDGKIACLMGIEGGHIIENDLGALRMFYQLGVRYMTLTHSFNIDWADSAGTGETMVAEHDGLTDFGRDVVREMNRLGMMVDVSHVADSTFWDVIATTKAPIIASHSSCRALADHPRNMSDEMIRALAKNGGVIQINFYPGYIDPERVELLAKLRPQFDALAKQYVDDAPGLVLARRELFKRAIAEAGGPSPAHWVVDHVEHVIKLVGEDYVGLGADWDGVPEMPAGLEDVSKVKLITEELVRRGYGERTIKKVLGGNLLRVMRKVEKKAE